MTIADEIARMKAAAEKASQGAWRVDRSGWIIAGEGDEEANVARAFGFNVPFIALCNPAAILRIAAHVERLEAIKTATVHYLQESGDACAFDVGCNEEDEDSERARENWCLYCDLANRVQRASDAIAIAAKEPANG